MNDSNRYEAKEKACSYTTAMIGRQIKAQCAFILKSP